MLFPFSWNLFRLLRTIMIHLAYRNKEHIRRCSWSVGWCLSAKGVHRQYDKCGNEYDLDRWICLICITLLEKYGESGEYGPAYINALIAARDFDEIGLIRFFSKRINCSCLTARCNQAKMYHPSKRGACENCNETRERKSLMSYAHCKMTQYFSKECQAAHWLTHNKYCSAFFRLAKNDACKKDCAAFLRLAENDLRIVSELHFKVWDKVKAHVEAHSALWVNMRMERSSSSGMMEMPTVLSWRTTSNRMCGHVVVWILTLGPVTNVSWIR